MDPEKIAPPRHSWPVTAITMAASVPTLGQPGVGVNSREFHTVSWLGPQAKGLS